MPNVPGFLCLGGALMIIPGKYVNSLKIFSPVPVYLAHELTALLVRPNL